MTGGLRSVVTFDNTDELRRITDRTYNRNRTIHIRFERNGDGYTLQAWGSAFPQDGAGGYRGRLNVEPTTVDAGIRTLRTMWQEHVVDHEQSRRRFPFIELWDLSGPDDRGRIDEIGLTLAQAGHTLFQLLFFDGDAGLKEIGDLLVQALREGEQVITMESDDLFVPWGMLYVPPEETELWAPDAKWSMHGFWGYRHLVEHSFSRVPGFDSRIMVQSDQVVVGLNVDRGVDAEYPPTPCIGPVVSFFTDRASVVLRHSKDKFAYALRDPLFSDHIFFIGCHGEVSNGEPGLSSLTLEDGGKIYSSEVQGWLSGRSLPSQPMVFVSACQGGQLASLFYPAFGHHLLKHGARCLIGPQVDLPKAFAREYTTRLFSAFLQPNTKLGDIMLALTREFADEYRNPLGLIFSLYRGIDVHLSPPEQT